jgi:putative membrane protein
MMGLWWVLLIIFALAVGGYFVRGSSGSAPASSRPSRRETPLEALERRYAEGEISTEEYEERKRKLTEDT